jgi:Reverse transcriptase (RNA-dependent DNA polymerase)
VPRERGTVESDLGVRCRTARSLRRIRVAAMSSPSVKLTAAELDAALSYVEADGASDFFPQPFEIAALRHSWAKVRPALEAVDLLSYQARECFEMTAPKQRCLVRPVHLLDPVDCLLYTGLTFRLAAAIEVKRSSYQRDRVFSCHFNPSAMGSRETFTSDWDGHTTRLKELAEQHDYVGATDIVDFFPRVYLHRLENSIADLSADGLGTTALMRLVETWSHGTSYGLPTGPRASNYLSEALLVEVDEYLLSCDIEFVRWVDDYSIFGESEADVVSGLFRLGERLNQTQGLSLNASKTRIRTCETFSEKVLQREDPVAELKEKILGIASDDGNPYARIDYDSLTDEQKEAVDGLDVRSTLEKALDRDLVDLKSIKFILTFMSAFRRPDLVDLVLDNLPRLLPVADSVAKFFDALDDAEEAAHADIGARIMKYINSDGFVPDFQAMWLLDPFTKSTNWNNTLELRKLARDATNRFVRRQAVLGLRQIGERSALLDAKSALDDRRDWEQRAILHACSRLPKDEAEAIATQVGGHGGTWSVTDCLRKAVVAFMKAG